VGARASASFPVAFAPVYESNELRARRTDDAGTGTTGWLADGGLLDNAPFEPLLNALKERRIDKPFERILLYVTPGVGTGAVITGDQLTPSLGQALGWVTRAMREPDERLDRDALRETFALMKLVETQPFMTIKNFMTDPTPWAPFDDHGIRQAAAAILPQYRRNRAVALMCQLAAVSGLNVSPLAPPPPATTVPEGLPGIPAELAPTDVAGRWTWGVATADRVLRWWGRALARVELPDQGTAIPDAMNAVADGQRRTAELWTEMTSAVTGVPTPLLPAQQLANLSAFYQQPQSQPVECQLWTIVAGAAAAIAEALPAVSVATLIELSLSLDVLSTVYSWGNDEFDTPVFRYQNLTPAVGSPIDIGPVSELDGWASRKLYGERWGHFGAFSGRRQRRYDWVGGRLDGASQISDSLLRSAEVDSARVADLRTNLFNAILSEENLSIAEMAERSNEAYYTTASSLLHRLLHDVDTMATVGGDTTAPRPQGPRLVKQLIRTVLQVLLQGQAPGSALRVLLAPIWSANDLPPSSRIRRPFTLARAYGLRGVGAPVRFIVTWCLWRRVKRAASAQAQYSPPQLMPSGPQVIGIPTEIEGAPAA
jgi:hypothetical protein